MQSNCFIRGNGMVKSGEYEKIEICGVGGFENNIFANKIVVNGSVNMGENVEADIVEVNGTCFSDGSVKCNKMFINGIFKSNKLNSIECDIREGEIRAKNIKIIGDVFVKSLFSDFIIIAPQKLSFLSKFLKKTKEKSIIKYIEGKYIKIDNIIVERIDCDKIIVGKNCYIKQLNCKEKAEIKKGAFVNNIKGNFVYK